MRISLLTVRLIADLSTMHDFPPDTPDSQIGARLRHPSEQAAGMAKRLTWFLFALAALLLATFFVPYFVEQIQYSSTRGRQRAELEAAKEGLRQLPLAELSMAYQLVSKRVAPSVVHINVASSLIRGGPTNSMLAFSAPILKPAVKALA